MQASSLLDKVLTEELGGYQLELIITAGSHSDLTVISVQGLQGFVEEFLKKISDSKKYLFTYAFLPILITTAAVDTSDMY